MVNTICQLVPKLVVLKEFGFLPNDDEVLQHEYPFLDNTLPVECAFNMYFDLHMTVPTLMARACTGTHRKGVQFWSLLDERKPVDALYHALKGDDWKTYSRNRFQLNTSDIHNCFVFGVVSEFVSTVSNDEKREQYASVARNVWNDGAGVRHVNLTTLDAFEADYGRLRVVFRDLIGSIRAYFASTKTEEFLAEMDDPLAGSEQTFSRMDAMNTVYDFKSDPRVKQWVESRNYQQLLSHHRDMFNNPLRFGFSPHQNDG